MRRETDGAEEKEVRRERYCYMGPSIGQTLRGAKVAFIRGSVFIGQTPKQLTEGMDPEVGAAIRGLMIPVEEMAAVRGDMQRGSALWAGRVRRLEGALRKSNKGGK